jgi:hypothetical protein
MHTLNTDQQAMLLEMLNEDFGDHLEFEEFSDVLLGLFEDIPGLETTSQSKINQLINHIWSKYHGKANKEY